MVDDALVATLLQALDAAPDLFPRLAEELTLERAHRYLAALEAVPCPSQTARWTRIPAIEALLRADGVIAPPRVVWDGNYGGTGNAALILGRRLKTKRVWILSAPRPVSPTWSSRATASVTRCCPSATTCSNPDGGRRWPWPSISADRRWRCRRVARSRSRTARCASWSGRAARSLPACASSISSDLTWDRATNRISGHLDDSVGVTASLLAAGVLRHYPVEVFFGFTDEEEGPPGDSTQSFGRGGRRLVALLPCPELAIVADVHESEAMTNGPGPRDLHPGDGAVFAERSSNGRGSATPPNLYVLQQHLAAALAQRGIRLKENWGGYVSRSEDINAVLRTPHVALIGVLCSNRHYAMDRPAANLADVVELAKVFVAYTLLVHSDVWPRVMG